MTATKSREEVIPLGGMSRKVGARYCESLTVDSVHTLARESPSCTRTILSTSPSTRSPLLHQPSAQSIITQ